MGIWNGQQCRNECAHAVTIGRMHVEVPHMWHYPMPECLHNAMVLNKNVDRVSYQHIAHLPSKGVLRMVGLAFLGLEDLIHEALLIQKHD